MTPTPSPTGTLVITRRLAVPAAAAWAHVSDPERMNRWSTARIELLALGDGDRSDGVGTYRAVHLPAGGRVLKEVIEVSSPPNAMVYRVVETPGVKSHRGEIRLDDLDDGCRLTWTVDFETNVGTTLVRRLLRRELERSVETLAHRAAADPAPAPAPFAAFDDTPSAEERATAEAVLLEQRRMADDMFARTDPKRWFARVYEYVTENQLAWLARGEVHHPAWVLRLIPAFHRLYVGALRAYEDPSRLPEPQWRAAFSAMEDARDPARAVAVGLLKGVRAHIEEDLPRALAEVYVRHYRDRCSFARFRADYLRMSPIFEGASERLGVDMPAAATPRRYRVLGSVLPDVVIEEWRRKRFYDVPRRRREAFERGERIARLLLETAEAIAPPASILD